jgi:hypothetical protein
MWSVSSWTPTTISSWSMSSWCATFPGVATCLGNTQLRFRRRGFTHLKSRQPINQEPLTIMSRLSTQNNLSKRMCRNMISKILQKFLNRWEKNRRTYTEKWILNLSSTRDQGSFCKLILLTWISLSNRSIIHRLRLWQKSHHKLSSSPKSLRLSLSKII